MLRCLVSIEQRDLYEELGRFPRPLIEGKIRLIGSTTPKLSRMDQERSGFLHLGELASGLIDPPPSLSPINHHVDDATKEMKQPLRSPEKTQKGTREEEEEDYTPIDYYANMKAQRELFRSKHQKSYNIDDLHQMMKENSSIVWTFGK